MSTLNAQLPANCRDLVPHCISDAVWNFQDPEMLSGARFPPSTSLNVGSGLDSASTLDVTLTLHFGGSGALLKKELLSTSLSSKPHNEPTYLTCVPIPLNPNPYPKPEPRTPKPCTPPPSSRNLNLLILHYSMLHGAG